MKSSLQVLNEGFLKKYLVEDVEEEETEEIEVGDLFTKGDETYKLLDVQIDEEGNVVVEAENQETEKPEEIEYISKEEAEENTEEEIATDDYKEDAEEAEFEKSLEVEEDDEESEDDKKVKDECLTEGEIGRTAGKAIGSRFGMSDLGGKIGSTIEDTAVDAFKVYRDTYELSNREALLRLAKLAANKVSSRFPAKNQELAYECVDFRKLRECARNLKEAQMSPEDEKDTAILRGIINKSIRRKNAKLTPEEKEILDKYGLYRDSYEGDVRKKLDDKPDYYGQTAPLVNYREYDRQKWSRDRSPIGFSKDKINLADRARKMDTRGSGYEANNVYANYDSSREYKKTGEDKYTRLKGKGLLDQERALQNTIMQGNYNGMKNSLNNKKIWQSNLDTVDSRYDKKIADLEKQIANAKKDKEDERSRYAQYVNAEQRYINKLLKREESLSEELLDRHVSDFNSDVYNALAKVMYKWDRKGIQPSAEDMDKAYEWFSLHFYTSDDWYL